MEEQDLGIGKLIKRRSEMKRGKRMLVGEVEEEN